MGCEIAAHLSLHDKEVCLAEMLSHLASDLENRSRAALLQLLKEKRVETKTERKVLAIEPGRVICSNPAGAEEEVRVDSVILALGLKPNRALVQPLKDSFKEVYVIGDCLQPRKIYQAVHEGAYAGRAIR
jgi:2-enoate reductase